MRFSKGFLACVLLLPACGGSDSGPASGASTGSGGVATMTTTGSGPSDAAQPGEPGGAGGAAGASGTASGTGGGSIDAGPAPMVEAGPPSPALRIIFPPPGAVANDSIVVRGTNTLADPVTAIRVNDVMATSADGFATYRAVVPLKQGDNLIVVSAEGKNATALGSARVTVQRFADEASIQRGGGDPYSIFRIFGFTIDTNKQEAIVCDDIFDGLVRIDLATGNRALASASESSAKGMVGKGYNDIAQPRDVALDAPGHALLVDGPKLVGVDLASGDRTLLSGGGAGSGPDAMQFGAVDYDAAAHRAIAIDYQINALFAIDPVMGTRTVLSSTTIGTGVAWSSFGTVELDASHGRALTTRPYSNPIIGIDLKSGNRTVLSGDNAGTGPALQEPTALATAASLGLVFAWDKTGKHLLSVDLATGNRRLVADGTTGMGPSLSSLDHLAFAQDLLYAEQGMSLLALDPIEGHRVVVSK